MPLPSASALRCAIRFQATSSGYKQSTKNHNLQVLLLNDPLFLACELCTLTLILEHSEPAQIQIIRWLLSMHRCTAVAASSRRFLMRTPPVVV